MSVESKISVAADDGSDQGVGCGAAPHRVRLSRTRGFRLPPNTVVVSRPSKWGNPYKLGGFVPGYGSLKTMADVVEAYRREVTHRMQQDTAHGAWLRNGLEIELRGRNLACWCPLDQPCHADALLTLANADDHRSAVEECTTCGNWWPADARVCPGCGVVREEDEPHNKD